MPKHSPIKYNPNLSVKDNAAKNGCTVGAIRYWLEVNKIDRRAEQTAKTITKLRECYKDGMTLAMLAKDSGYSINTIKKYMPYVTAEVEPSEITEKLKTLTVRQRSDYYATHPSVTNDLLSVEDFSSPILEPCCGGGFMADVIRQKGYEVYATDIVDRGYGVGNIDFLAHDFPVGKYDIVTNPPYSLFVPMIEKAMAICNRKVAMLLPLRYLTSKERYEVFKKYPPKCVYVYIERICIAKNGDFETYNDAGANLEMYAWYVWNRGFNGETTLRWIHNKR